MLSQKTIQMMNMPTVDLSNYDIVDFNDMTTNRPKKVRGLRVGESLIVSGSTGRYGIYCIYNGKRIFNLLFINLEDAIKMGEWLNEQFDEYFPILSVFTDIEFFRVIQLTVKDGVLIYNTIKALEPQRRIERKNFFEKLEKMREYGQQ